LCAIEHNITADCTHETVAERALIGTWVMDEVRLAVQKVYEVTEIFEVYEYEVAHYNRETGDGGLFVHYINTFLKLKAEASGYPSWVRTPTDEDQYVQTFFANEGIMLPTDAIQLNASQRALAKLCLNSFWGKLTERNNRTKSKMIADPHELYKFLVTPWVEVTRLLFATDGVVWVTWRVSEDVKIPCLRHTNEVIGAYVRRVIETVFLLGYTGGQSYIL
jgi:hypothetical protein